MIKLLTLSEEDEIVYMLFHPFSSERKWDGSLSGFWIIFRKFKKQVSLQVFWGIYNFQDFQEPAPFACLPALIPIPSFEVQPSPKHFQNLYPLTAWFRFTLYFQSTCKEFTFILKVTKIKSLKMDFFYHNILSLICDIYPLTWMNQQSSKYFHLGQYLYRFSIL